jgi:hypothetical protein
MGGWEDDFMMSSEIQERPGKKGMKGLGKRAFRLWLSNDEFVAFKRVV